MPVSKPSLSTVKQTVFKPKWLIGIVVLVLALAFFLVSGGPKEDANATLQPQHRSVRVQTWTVQPILLTDILTLPGETEARHDVTVSAESSGRVEWIGPGEGDLVTPDETIARIDMDNSQADLSEARSAYDLAKKQAERRGELLERQVLSKEEMDKANTDLAKASSALALARKALNRGDVVSPVPGAINELFVDPGEWVNTGEPVAEIVDATSIRININVPELDVRYLNKGEKVHVTVDAYPEETWEGEVDFVGLKADESTKTFRVRVVVANDDLRIRPGMLARVSMQRRSIDGAITAPLHAIMDKGGERLLFVAEDGVARAHKIKLGVISGSRIQILEGLKAGEKLIVSGQNEVEEGVAVEVTGEVDQ